MTELLSALHQVGAEARIVQRHTLLHPHVDASLTQREVFLRQHVPSTMNEDGQDVGSQLLGQIKSTFVEAQDVALRRAGALWEHGNGIAPLVESAQLFDVVLDAVAHRIEFSVVDDSTIEGIVPHPVFGEEHHAGGEHQQAHQVELRLVVADDD